MHDVPLFIQSEKLWSVTMEPKAKIHEVNSTSYPESSGSLASGWSPGETLGKSKKNYLF